MSTKIIIKLPTDNQNEIERFLEIFQKEEVVIIPEYLKLLVKNERGYWEEK
jgi:hypothetical protein